MKKLFWLMSLMFFWSCAPKYFVPLPKKNASKERIDKAKSFADSFFDKCNKKDYSEINGFVMDVNTKKFYFSPEKIEIECKKINDKYGNVFVSEFFDATTLVRPTDYYDYFIFKTKLEKSDSIKYVSVGFYRDKDIIGGLKLSSNAYPKIIKRKKK